MIKNLLLILFILLLAVVYWAITQKPISESGALLLEDPWGIATLIDLYIGLIIFSLFILLIEKDFLKTLVWTLCLLTLGNLTSLVYLLLNYSKIKKLFKKVQT